MIYILNCQLDQGNPFENISFGCFSFTNSSLYVNCFSCLVSLFLFFFVTSLIGRRFKVQMDDDLKHTAKSTQEFLKVKKWNILQWPSQSPVFNLTEHVFYSLKTKLKVERPSKRTTEVSCSKGLAKHHKEGNPVSGDVSGDVHEFQT